MRYRWGGGRPSIGRRSRGRSARPNDHPGWRHRRYPQPQYEDPLCVRADEQPGYRGMPFDDEVGYRPSAYTTVTSGLRGIPKPAPMTRTSAVIKNPQKSALRTRGLGSSNPARSSSQADFAQLSRDPPKFSCSCGLLRELGLNPKKLGKLDNHHQEPWKLPLPLFIEKLYRKRFGKDRPVVVVSIEDRARLEEQRRAARRQAKRQDQRNRTVR
jgi:hypothetical protein